MSEPDYKNLFFSLCGSIALNEGHDCADDVFTALKKAGIVLPEYVDDLSQVFIWMGKELGATTLYDTNLYDPAYDDCPECKRLKIECNAEYPQTCPLSDNPWKES